MTSIMPLKYIVTFRVELDSIFSQLYIILINCRNKNVQKKTKTKCLVVVASFTSKGWFCICAEVAPINSSVSSLPVQWPALCWRNVFDSTQLPWNPGSVANGISYSTGYNQPTHEKAWKARRSQQSRCQWKGPIKVLVQWQFVPKLSLLLRCSCFDIVRQRWRLIKGCKTLMTFTFCINLFTCALTFLQKSKTAQFIM